MQSETYKQFVNYRLWIESELIQRCEKNARYSLRAFSKALKMSPAFVSRILSGKRPLTIPSAEKIAEALNFTPSEREHLIGLVVQGQRTQKGPARIPQKRSADQFMDLTMDIFTSISEWYHYPITELTFLKHSNSDPRWIAKTLGISVMEAKSAVERLIRLGILQKKGNKLAKVVRPMTTTHNVPFAALRKFHKQILEKAISSLEDHEVSERDITSITMAMDPKKLPQAKEKIKKFRRELCKFLEAGDVSRVYSLSVQLFPLSKLEAT